MRILPKFVKSLNDLTIFNDIARDYQLIGLGEATHGNKEFHIVRANVSKYLIETHDYAGLVMEFPHSKSKNINKFVVDGKGKLSEIMNNIGYWTCATEEVKEFVIWLREFNQRRERKVFLFGNDVDIDDKVRLSPGSFRDRQMYIHTRNIVGNKKYILWSHNHHISKFRGDDFTSLGYSISKKIKYYSIATLFYEGSLLAVEYNSTKSQWGDLKSFQLSKAENESLESNLKSLGIDELFLDITSIPANLKNEFNKVKARFLGAGYDPKEKSTLFQYMNFSQMFDGLIFIKKVSPSILIRDN